MSSSYRDRLARRLVEAGFAALIVGPDYSSFAYPEILALVPAAVALIRQRPELDASRIGLAGHDLGADLAIRVAGSTADIKAVAAIAPVMTEVPVSLDVFRELTYWPAWQWCHDLSRRRLWQDLDAARFAQRIARGKLLVVYGTEDTLVRSLPEEEWQGAREQGWVDVQAVAQARHFDLLTKAALSRKLVHWFRERL
jgi:dienelactone hydrolase